MATAEELLYEAGSQPADFIIDLDRRMIKIPDGVSNLGVESDDEVLTIQFRMASEYCGVDLSKFHIWINYKNAAGEPDTYDVRNAYVDNDGTLVFTWLVGRHAAVTRGDVEFSICMKESDSNGKVLREFNTTPATLPILKGLETGPQAISEYTDILEQWRAELFGPIEQLQRTEVLMVDTENPQGGPITASHTPEQVRQHVYNGGKAVMRISERLYQLARIVSFSHPIADAIDFCMVTHYAGKPFVSTARLNNDKTVSVTNEYVASESDVEKLQKADSDLLVSVGNLSEEVEFLKEHPEVLWVTMTYDNGTTVISHTASEIHEHVLNGGYAILRQGAGLPLNLVLHTEDTAQFSSIFDHTGNGGGLLKVIEVDNYNRVSFLVTIELPDKSYVDSIKDVAAEASAAASETANTALTAANTAGQEVYSLKQKIDTELAPQIETASSDASQALTAANTASSNASAALATANAASSDASTASSDASRALTVANTAGFNTANLADTVTKNISPRLTTVEQSVDSIAATVDELVNQTLDAGAQALIVTYNGSEASQTVPEIVDHIDNGGVVRLKWNNDLYDLTRQEAGILYFTNTNTTGLSKCVMLMAEGTLIWGDKLPSEFQSASQADLTALGEAVTAASTDASEALEIANAAGNMAATVRDALNMGAIPRLSALEETAGDIDAALDAIIAIQENLIGGDG